MEKPAANPGSPGQFTLEQISQALRRAGIDGLEDPAVVAVILNQTLAQGHPAFSALPFDLEPSHYRVALERRGQ